MERPVSSSARLDLRSLSPEAARAVLQQAMARGEAFEVLGWRLAERNLDIPAVMIARVVSWLRGWPHRATLSAGGIEGALCGTLLASGREWQVFRTPALCGAATLVRAEKFLKKTLDSAGGSELYDSSRNERE